MSRFRSTRRSDWVGLGEASRLLGVAPGTLRRWSDNGRVAAFTTPGGHRRYRRAALERLVGPGRGARAVVSLSGMSPSRLSRAYRLEARNALAALPWLTGLTDEQREWFRTHGRVLAGSLIAYLDAANEHDASESQARATSEAAAYGRLAAGLGISLSQAVEGFLQFRRPFLHQLGLFAVKRGLDAPATAELMETTERVVDRLLLASMNAFSVQRVGSSYGLHAESEGVR